MNTNRDNFTSKTIDILAKRVGYICSNPSCRVHTIGPNENKEKATVVGEAAHISAAAPGGPRFDQSLTDSQRKHPDNGIWLCNICSTLIDRNPENYTKELLQDWKRLAEEEMLNKLNGNSRIQTFGGFPVLEADLICSFWGRSNRGYSNKNPIAKHDGRLVMVPGNKPVVFWELWWKYSFIIINNSSHPAYNIKIENMGESQFLVLKKMPKINNLPPYQSIDLEAEYSYIMESSYVEADNELSNRIPDRLNGLTMRISYFDEQRKLRNTIVNINNNNVENLVQ